MPDDGRMDLPVGNIGYPFPSVTPPCIADAASGCRELLSFRTVGPADVKIVAGAVFPDGGAGYTI